MINSDCSQDTGALNKHYSGSQQPAITIPPRPAHRATAAAIIRYNWDYLEGKSAGSLSDGGLWNSSQVAGPQTQIANMICRRITRDISPQIFEGAVPSQSADTRLSPETFDSKLSRCGRDISGDRELLS